MNPKHLALVLLAAGGATASAAPNSPRVLGTWDGTSAFAFNKDTRAVYATSTTSAGYTKQSGSVMTDSSGFQCVELAMRYFHFRKHIPVASWGGIGKAVKICDQRAPGVSKTSHPVAGDLVVLKAWDDHAGTVDAGHVAIVTAVKGDAISTFTQNWNHDATAHATVSQKQDVLCYLHAATPEPGPGARPKSILQFR